MWVVFATHIFFSKNINIYAIFNDQSFNDTLTNVIVGFEQLGPDCFSARQALLVWIYTVCKILLLLPVAPEVLIDNCT